MKNTECHSSGSDTITRRITNDVTLDAEEYLHACLRKVIGGYITPSKVFYTRREACDLLRCGFTKFHDLVNNNELEKVKLGSRSLVTKSSVDALIAKLKLEGNRVRSAR